MLASLTIYSPLLGVLYQRSKKDSANSSLYAVCSQKFDSELAVGLLDEKIADTKSTGLQKFFFAIEHSVRRTGHILHEVLQVAKSKGSVQNKGIGDFTL